MPQVCNRSHIRVPATLVVALFLSTIPALALFHKKLGLKPVNYTLAPVSHLIVTYYPYT